MFLTKLLAPKIASAIGLTLLASVIGLAAWIAKLKIDVAQSDQALTALERDVEAAKAQAERDARTRETELRAAFDKQRTTLLQEVQDAQIQRDNAAGVADALRRGERRLRDRLACPPSGGDQHNTTIHPNGVTADGASGFTVEDGAIALGIAADGDQRIRRLNARLAACLNVLEAERAD